MTRLLPATALAGLCLSAADGTVSGRGHTLTFRRLETGGWKVIFDTGAPE